MSLGSVVVLLIVLDDGEIKTGTQVLGMLQEHLFIVFERRADLASILGLDPEIIERNTSLADTSTESDEHGAGQ